MISYSARLIAALAILAAPTVLTGCSDGRSGPVAGGFANPCFGNPSLPQCQDTYTEQDGTTDPDGTTLEDGTTLTDGTGPTLDVPSWPDVLPDTGPTDEACTSDNQCEEIPVGPCQLVG